MIRLYTEEYFFKGKVKALIKRLLGRYMRGPQVVVEGLRAGLLLLGTEFTINQKPERGDVCGVLNGVHVLSWAIRQKQAGVFSTLIAGPNIVVSPQDSGGILTSAYIDMVLVPSMWVQDAYRNEAPEISGKIAVWAAGVPVVPQTKKHKRNMFLIFNKIPGSDMYRDIAAHLSKEGYSHKTISYGSFSQKKYFSLLEDSQYLVYISETESQGLAMFEAAARGLPIIAFEPGRLLRREKVVTGIVATPYISSEMGARFSSLEDFTQKLPGLLKTSFNTRAYIENKFSLQKVAEKYMEVLRHA